jgi:FkbM family methyltransferase
MDIRYPNDFISQHLLQRQEYEWYVIELITALCDSHDRGHILDIGANMGTVSLPLAQKFPNYVISAFEVQPELHSVLQRNVDLNQLSNINVYSFGLGSVNETKTIAMPDYDSAKNIGAFSLHDYVLSKSSIAQGQGKINTVDIVPLDSVDLGDLPIRCIKLDVEGYELAVLQGAVQTLAQHHYPPLVYESWSYNAWWNDHRQELETFLKHLGYNSFTKIDDTVVAQFKQ